MAELIKRFMEIFRGYEHAHGQHKLFDQPDETGKLQGIGKTVGSGAGEKEYGAHLKGSSGPSLGLIPLMANDTCWFGAIDIDIKGPNCLRETLEHLEARIRKLELPLVFCRSKSGGAHLYLLAEEPLPAKLVQPKLMELAASIGYGGCEIFPKQTTRANAEDRGNWINICYYGALSPDGTERYALRNGKPIRDLAEFLKYAEMMRIGKDAFKKVDVKLSELFSDGPPCLQHLATIGFEEGGRNTALTNVAIYYKKCDPDNWQEKVRDFNQKHVASPLDGGEVGNIINNVGRKEYWYTCKLPPICNHCDKKLCSKREFGIEAGRGGDLLRFENLHKYFSRDSVRWYAEYQGTRFPMQTEHFGAPGYSKLCLERFNKVVHPKQKDLDEMFNEGLLTVVVAEDPEDASRQGQFENLLDNYFSQSRPARNKDELIKGNSFIEDGRIIFRSEDLINYLNIHRFQHTPPEVWTWLTGMKAEAHQIRVKGKKLRVWTLPEPEKYDTATGIDLPADVEEEL